MRLIIVVIICGVLLTGCGKKDQEVHEVPVPAKSTLILPAQNSACTTGAEVSVTESTVTFNWLKADNADSYDVSVKNLQDGSLLEKTVNTNSADITLKKNTPYSWHVTSKANGTDATAVSDTWRFYNTGPGITNFAPFPAAITSPLYNEALSPKNGTVTLSWEGSDIDNDIKSYIIYLGTDKNSLPILKEGITDMFLKNASVVSKTTYYWKVITTDSKGNTSDSGLYQFGIK